MIQLTQGMYADLNCKTFGLSYGQNRIDDVVRNAGWFNQRGEKLGYGDVSLQDLDNIAGDIPDGELFIVLNEGDTNWNIPSNLDRFNPGIDYVMNHAKWIISGFKDTKYNLYSIKDIVYISNVPHYTNADKLCYDINTNTNTNANISYYEMTRDSLFNSLGYIGGIFNQLNNPTNVVIKPNFYYGLDVYEHSDGSSWAIGEKEAACEAAYLKIQDDLYATNLIMLRTFLPVRRSDIDILQDMVDKYGQEASNILKVMLGDNLEKYITEHLASKGCGFILANYDALEKVSDNIDGLPKGFYAYRID